VTTDLLARTQAGLPWPLPALLAWLSAWGAYQSLSGLETAPWVNFCLSSLMGGLWACFMQSVWRRWLIVAGFPLSWCLITATQAQGPLMAWGWLVPMLLLVSLYPVRVWSGAPLFPTPEQALQGLSSAAPLPPGACIFDAGSGLGDGLKALSKEYPQARLMGCEWSLPLACLSRWRVPQAEIVKADIWQQDWSEFQMVYLFQRPESMARAGAKALKEMRPGAFLVSLEFEWLAAHCIARLEPVEGKPVWVYQAPFVQQHLSPEKTTAPNKP